MENKHPGVLAAYKAGKSVNLKIVVKDEVGNLGTASPEEGTSGNAGTAIFDNKEPEVSRLFPNTTDLKDKKVGGPEDTQNPIFRISEAADSILARYDGSEEGFLDVAGLAADKSNVGKNIELLFDGDNVLQEDDVYDLQVYVEDLAGYIGTSELQIGLTFDNSLVNPSADEFTIDTFTSDDKNKNKPSVIAGQALKLTVTANDTELDRAAVTYDTDGVQVSTKDSDGNLVSGVSYSGTGVMDDDDGDGSATLDGDTWTAGVFDGITLISKQAGTLTVSVTENGRRRCCEHYGGSRDYR